MYAFFFFFNDTATTEIYTLSLHDALPISYPDMEVISASRSVSIADSARRPTASRTRYDSYGAGRLQTHAALPSRSDRKSTRLNSSHANISYAVFCLKKKTHTTNIIRLIFL